MERPQFLQDIPRTVDGVFRAAARRTPDRIFIEYFDGAERRQLTYRQAAARIATIATQLRTLDIGVGDRVICYLDDMQQSIWQVLACAHAGAVVLPLSAKSSTVASLVRVADRVRAKAIFTSAEHVARVAAADLRALCFEPVAGAVHVATDEHGGDALAILDAMGGEHGTDDLYSLFPTSGTTGAFKMVMKRHAVTFRNATWILFGSTPVDAEPVRMLMVSTLMHGLGHLYMTASMMVSGRLQVPRAIEVDTSLADVRALDPTHIYATPRVLRALSQQSTGGRLFGPSARIVRLAGAPADQGIFESLLSQGVDVGECYGTVEIGYVSVTPVGGWKPGFCGEVLADTAVRIADDNEILARIPGALGYFEEPGLTNEAFVDGFYHTGDYGELVGGQLRILGRKLDRFNMFDGSNILPLRIEALIEGLGWVEQVALVGDQRPYVVALILPRERPPGGSDYLDPQQHAALYEQARRDLATINATLDPIEQVRRFVLLARPMSSELCTPVGAGKTRRDRKAIQAAHAAVIQQLYAAEPTGVALVPAAEAS